MSTQGKVQISSGNPLEWGGVVTNVATNEADIALMREAAADVSGKTIAPTEVLAKRMSLDEGLVVDGDSIRLADGIVSARHLVTSEQLIVSKAQIGGAIIDGDHLDLGPNGELSALSSNIGTMTAGILDVTSGNLDIGSEDTGISILGGVLMQMKYAGVVTISMDASTGIVTCNNFDFTTDNAPEGAIQRIDGGIQIGDSERTVGDQIRTFAQPTDPSSSFTLFVGDIWIDTDDGNVVKRWNGTGWDTLQDADIALAVQAAQDAEAAADGKVTTWFQATPPTAEAVGDLWFDTDDLNKCYRAASAGADEVKAGEWVAVRDGYILLVEGVANGKITTFYQTSAPTATATGDLWVDTDDGNKLYRWNGSSWILIRDAGATAGASAVQPGGGVTVDGSKYIIHIQVSSGLVISTAAGGSTGIRTQMTAYGVAVYNSSNQVVSQMDYSNGHTVCRRTASSEPALPERYSILDGDTEVGWIGATSTGMSMVGPALRILGNTSLTLDAGGTITINGTAIALTVDVTVSSGKVIKAKHACQDGTAAKADGTFTFYAASTSGGSPTKLHTVTFKDGLITSWSAA